MKMEIDKQDGHASYLATDFCRRVIDDRVYNPVTGKDEP